MASYEGTMNRVADRIIDLVGQADDLAVKAATAVNERLDAVLPDRLPGASFVRNLPTPEEYVRTYFDFVERLVKTQRAYALNMAKAFRPINRRIWPQGKVAKAA
ncbi:MAG TPA: hypothetical protein VHL78_08540 [Actinomycetota bacterium]|nr:hypothetical protein [Actinomycetota bacterium]